MYTPYHSKYWAAALTCKGAGGSIDSLSRSIASAKVDLNPHQVDAALFAIRSPLSKGVLLADEVGLGKTIEAGLVLSQMWAERRRRLKCFARMGRYGGTSGGCKVVGETAHYAKWKL